jgi:hypothetical protein
LINVEGSQNLPHIIHIWIRYIFTTSTFNRTFIHSIEQDDSSDSGDLADEMDDEQKQSFRLLFMMMMMILTISTSSIRPPSRVFTSRQEAKYGFSLKARPILSANDHN